LGGAAARRAQQLERDPPLERRIPGLVDHTHRPATEEPADLKACEAVADRQRVLLVAIVRASPLMVVRVMDRRRVAVGDARRLQMTGRETVIQHFAMVSTFTARPRGSSEPSLLPPPARLRRGLLACCFYCLATFLGRLALYKRECS